MGQYDTSRGGAMYLVETPEDVRDLQVQHPDDIAYVTQTTLSVDDTLRVIDALKARFPGIEGPRRDDICYATQNRQDAVKALAVQCDVILVVGSPNSSNSGRGPADPAGMAGRPGDSRGYGRGIRAGTGG
jgi:4-hydroxy-3-methylbut-2-enyl diphosphate reductase